MSWFDKLSSGLKKTAQSLDDALNMTSLNEETLEALEESLIMADLGTPSAMAITEEMRNAKVRENIPMEQVRELLATAIAKRLEPYAKQIQVKEHTPCIILVVGVNGNGKTTTIGKLANALHSDASKVVLVAADTFRAAAVEQLQHWAEKSGAGFVRGAPNADPASVVHAGLEFAKQQQAKVVFIDTAGRLHTKKELMAELEKITRVIRKLYPDAPHHVLQVLDATTGQNAIAQLAAFKEVAGVTGLIVTKLDGTAKAGIVVALTEKFSLPIHALGVGEGIDDLQPFDAADFARALVGA